MKIKISETTPVQLNWLVAKCEGVSWSMWLLDGYATDWSQGGPIIEREGISLTQFNDYPQWTANHPQSICYDGPTPLIAAMRCYVASKLGKECDVPDELITGE